MSTHQSPGRFRFPRKYNDPVRGSIERLVVPTVERVLGMQKLEEVYHNAFGAYADADDMKRRGVEPAQRVLDSMGVTMDVDPAAVARIPKTGPLIVVANHPFGGIEGLMLLALLRRVRQDVQVMGNYMLSRLDHLKDAFIYVDPFGGDSATERNLLPMRQTMRWMREGNALGIFPAGEVSHSTFRNYHAIDPRWSETIARIAMRSGSSVLPVYFHGRNGILFQMLGLVHPRLRTIMLPREFAKKQKLSLPVEIGSVIPPSRLARFKTAREATQYMRVRTYVLGNRAQGQDDAETDDADARPLAAPRHRVDIVEPVPADMLRAEVEALPESAVLLKSGDSVVYVTHAHDIPLMLREIGRLREVTFREVGEGTGAEIDLDAFDRYYLHLFMWNTARDELVGAYRLGATDEILPRYGKRGLYTYSLFRIHKKLLRQMGPALELGRSFVRKEYQRNYMPLLLLWKGIGEYVVRHPRYRNLFGPVSISNEYHSLSRQLLVAFMKSSRLDHQLRKGVKARRPLPKLRKRAPGLKHCSVVVQDMDDVDELIREIEADQRSVPVLVRQYLKLNASLLGFSIDPDFGSVVDGLMLVDLTRTDRRILTHYMGKQGIRTFLAHHGIDMDAP
jgi:putative hemolysin